MKAVRGTFNEDDFLQLSEKARTSLEDNLSKIKADKSTKYGQAQDILGNIKDPVETIGIKNGFFE